MTLFDIFMPEKKKFYAAKDLAGPCRFQTVDKCGSHDFLDKAKETFLPRFFCILLVYLVDWSVSRGFLSHS